MILNQVDNCQVMINVSGISKRKSLETKKKSHFVSMSLLAHYSVFLSHHLNSRITSDPVTNSEIHRPDDEA